MPGVDKNQNNLISESSYQFLAVVLDHTAF